MSWLGSNLLTASLLIMVVLVIRRPVARLFGARAAYALWLAPALRLVLPPLPQAASSIAATSSPTTAYWTLVVEPASERLAPIATILLTMWLAGALIMLLVHLTAHHRFLRKALAAGRPLVVEGVKIDIVETDAVDGPMATGLVHPLILVSADFAQRFTPDQRRFALLHEQLHHARGDIWASAAALIVTSILWFNPLAWLALGAFRRDMESACDAAVLSRTGRAAAPAYAETILRCAARPVPRSLCALTSIDELKGRLIMLKLNHGTLTKFAGLMVAGGLAVAGTIAVPAVAQESRPTTETTEIRKVIHDGSGMKRATSSDGKEMKVDCPGELTVIEAVAGNAPDKQEKAKMVFCSRSGDKAEIAAGLEKALTRVEGDKELNAALRADVSAKLRAKITELRTGN